MDKPTHVVTETVKGTVPSAIGAAQPSPSENPGTYITAEELALLLRLLSQVLQRGQGGAGNGFLLTPTYQSPTKTSCRSSINQVSILLPTDQRKQVGGCFLKGEHLLAEEAMTLLQTTHEIRGMD